MTEHTQVRGFDSAKRDRTKRKEFVTPPVPTFGAPTDTIFFLRNVTESTPLYVVAGDVRRVDIHNAEGKKIGEQIKRDTKLVLPDQTVAVQAQHWPEILKMLQKHSADGLKYFELESAGEEESAEQLYERLAKQDPKRAADLDKKIAKAKAGED